jgi:hypothetical protein
MQELASIYRGNIRFKETLDSTETVSASAESWIQLRSIISKVVTQLETSILSEIDRLVYTSMNIPREEPLAFWICLWTLIFSYKSHVIYAKAIEENPCKYSLPL